MLPERAIVGVPSAAVRVHPAKLMAPGVLLKSSIHSSAVLVDVPIQAISLTTTWSAGVSCAVSSPTQQGRAIKRARATREKPRHFGCRGGEISIYPP